MSGRPYNFHAATTPEIFLYYFGKRNRLFYCERYSDGSTLCTFGGSSWGKSMIRIQSCNDILIPTHISLCDGGAVKRGASKAKQHGIKSTQKAKVRDGCFFSKRFEACRAGDWK